MIGKVQRNEADIAVADFLKTLSRSEVVDFASQLYFVRFVLLRPSDRLVVTQSTPLITHFQCLLLHKASKWYSIRMEHIYQPVFK